MNQDFATSKIIIFSAPSGAGKTTIVKYLLANNPNLGFSVSACTRSKREGEQNGKDYYFLNPEEFKEKMDKGEFVEWQEVYENLYYGTLKSEVERLWNLGKAVVFDVDVKGGVNLKKYYGDKALAIFVKPPSMDVLKERLRTRNTETPESLQKRFAKMEQEMDFEKYFDLALLNENLEETFEKAKSMVNDFLNGKGF